MTQMSRRKPRFPLRLFLFLTSMLVAPSVAAAQETQPAPEPTPGADASVTAVQVEPDDAAATEDENEIVIRGRFIPEPMRQTSEVAAFLSNEDLERKLIANCESMVGRERCERLIRQAWNFEALADPMEAIRLKTTM